MPSRPVPPATRLGWHAAPPPSARAAAGPPRATSAATLARTACRATVVGPSASRFPPAPRATAVASPRPSRARQPRRHVPPRRLRVPPHRGGTPHRQPRPASARSPRPYRYRVQKLSTPATKSLSGYAIQQCALPSGVTALRPRPRSALASPRPGRPGVPAPHPRPGVPRGPAVAPCPASARSRVPVSRARLLRRPASPGPALCPRPRLRRPPGRDPPRAASICSSGRAASARRCLLHIRRLRPCLAGPRGPTIREYALG